MCSFIIVVFQPYIQIGLQLFNVAVEFLAERNLGELLQDRPMEALADSIGLRLSWRIHVSREGMRAKEGSD